MYVWSKENINPNLNTYSTGSESMLNISKQLLPAEPIWEDDPRFRNLIKTILRQGQIVWLIQYYFKDIYCVTLVWSGCSVRVKCDVTDFKPIPALKVNMKNTLLFIFIIIQYSW